MYNDVNVVENLNKLEYSDSDHDCFDNNECENEVKFLSTIYMDGNLNSGDGFSDFNNIKCCDKVSNESDSNIEECFNNESVLSDFDFGFFENKNSVFDDLRVSGNLGMEYNESVLGVFEIINEISFLRWGY